MKKALSAIMLTAMIASIPTWAETSVESSSSTTTAIPSATPNTEGETK